MQHQGRPPRAVNRAFHLGPSPLRLMVLCCILITNLLSLYAQSKLFEIIGTVSDAGGRPIAGAQLSFAMSGRTGSQTLTDSAGAFRLLAPGPGQYTIVVRNPGFQGASQTLTIEPATTRYRIDFRLAIAAEESVTVTSDVDQVDLFSPDPAEKVFVQQDLLDANPGRPGAPVSIPGYPIETASGGIKAPQYFAPGVAGDHGEPIAQFIAVGSYMVPNNLSANAHGNGYADPNILIAEALADVQVDGGSFNVMESNHAVNLAATYGLRSRVEPFLTLTGDDRDADLVAGLTPDRNGWLALEASYGNGFLKRLEHRRQYKINGQRTYDAGPHRITAFGVGYYGFSWIPGLVPISTTNAGDADYPGDTVDPRQKDQTHTALLALNDVWALSPQQQVQLSGFFRTYNLSLYSDFGQGLIRQSEFRTVAGGDASYADRLTGKMSLLAGLDLEREAPRRDDLDHYNFYTPGDMTDGPFTKVDGSNVTIAPIAPYAAVQGELDGSHLRYYAGWRRDQIDFDSEDLVQPQNSFHEWVGVNSPKATLAILPGPPKWTPLISLSGGESFFTEDPRIGTGNTRGSPVSRAHAYQLVASKALAHTHLRLTLGHTTIAEQLAKIDPDTGLQEDQGPGRLKFLTAAIRQNFSAGSVLLTFSKADARDINSGQPTAEAPRTMFDALGVIEKLPLRLQARGEFEYVGAKSLGTGCYPNPAAQCIGVPVKELRASIARPFREERFNVGINLLAARGYTGQTLETFYPSLLSQVTGVRIPSCASINLSYRFAVRQSR